MRRIPRIAPRFLTENDFTGGLKLFSLVGNINEFKVDLDNPVNLQRWLFFGSLIVIGPDGLFTDSFMLCIVLLFVCILLRLREKSGLAAGIWAKVGGENGWRRRLSSSDGSICPSFMTTDYRTVWRNIEHFIV